MSVNHGKDGRIFPRHPIIPRPPRPPSPPKNNSSRLLRPRSAGPPFSTLSLLTKVVHIVKVLFTSAVDPFSEIENRIRPLWPAYLAAFAKRALRQRNLQFRYATDATGNLKQELNDFRPDILALSSVTQNFGYAKEIAALAKSQKAKVIAGGIHVSSLPRSMGKDIDVACMGEGEFTFSELLKIYWECGEFPSEKLQNVAGVAWLDHGKLLQTPPRKERPEIDQIPHPDRKLIGYGRRGYVYSARGCPYNCVFCSATRYWGQIRYASPEYIVEEIMELADHGTKVVRFSDENFVANKPRLSKISALVREFGLHHRLKFSCWSRANDVTPEVVETLRAMNVVSVKLGLESGSPKTLEFLKGKDVTIEDNRRAVELFKKAGMQVNADFIFGVPQETEEDLEATLTFIRKTPIDFFDIDIFSPLPGTPVWELAKKRGLVDDLEMDWRRLNFKFIPHAPTAILLSNKLSFSQLKRYHKRFRRLRFFRNLRAVLFSPWIGEAPGLGLRRALERSVKTLRQLRGRYEPVQ